MEAVIFIGIQATGKSTFYQERFYHSHVRISLDMLRTRVREDILLEAVIRAKAAFVVDNTNVLRLERAKYIRAAKPAGYRVIGYYFESLLKDALRRNQQREGRAVVADEALRNKIHHLQPPSYSEGFDALYFVSIDPLGGFVVRDWPEQAP